MVLRVRKICESGFAASIDVGESVEPSKHVQRGLVQQVVQL